MRRRARALALGLLLTAVSAPVPAETVCTDNPWVAGWTPIWQPVFQGIEWVSACTTSLPTNPGSSGVRTQKANILRIDLTAPGIQFFTTPHSGTDETTGQVASDFLCKNGLQVAINANFFSPCCDANANPKDLCGLEISQGQIVSPPASSTSPAGAGALLLTKDNQASIVIVTDFAALPAGVTNAVAGSPQPPAIACSQTVPGPVLLVLDGVNQSSPDTDANPPESVAARTSVGLSKDGRTLYLLTIDGKDGSNSGAGFYDTAQWLIQLGAYSGLNLDGGGSTTMAMQRGDGVEILNSPSENCTQRFVGAFLGVRAAALPTPFVPQGCGPAVSCTGN